MRSVFGLRDRIFYGWVVVGAIIASGFIMMGVNSSFGVFFKSLEETFNLTRAATSSVMSLRMVFSGIAALSAGWAIDRYGPRVVFSVMGFFIGLSLLLTGLATDVWQIYITYGALISIGTGAVYVVMTSTVLRWFYRRRGLALGISGLGGGLGTAALAPLSAFFISGIGWQNTIMLLGALSWLVVLPAAQFLKRDPQEAGTLPDGEPAVYPPHPETETGAELPTSRALKKVFRTGSFWAVFFLWFALAFSAFFVNTHIVRHAIDQGYTSVQAATILSISGLAMMTGRLVAGIISDRVNAKLVAAVMSLVQGAAMLSLVWVDDLWLLYLFGLLHGLTFGGFGTSVTVLIGRAFALDDIGKLLGILEIGIFIGGAIGPYLGGLIFDDYGSYAPAFVLMSAVILLRILLLAPVKDRAAG